MNPTLQVAQGPEEISFTGQSPSYMTATPIGTDFIQGTGDSVATSLSPLIVIALVILGTVLLRHVR
jgi:hypothetical protein